MRNLTKAVRYAASAAALMLGLALAACEGDTIYIQADSGGSTPQTDSGSGGNGGGPDGTARDAGTGADAASPRDGWTYPDLPWQEKDSGGGAPYDAGDEPATCLPNDDGVVERSEVVLVFGATANYLANPEGTEVAVAPNGTPDPDDPTRRVWDFREGPRDLSVAVKVEAFDPGAWYAEHFPEDTTYVTPLGPQTPNVLGVFRMLDDRLEMLGLASRTDTQPRTLMIYDDPVALYHFPLLPPSGDQLMRWTATSTFSNAELMGVRQAGRETYRFQVDQAGTLILPNFTFSSVLRIRLDLTQTFVSGVGGNTFHTVQYFYFTECAGELARIVGPLVPGEEAPDPTSAREFRRLGL